MRETRTFTWCDPHYAGGQEITGKPYTLGSGNKWFTVDLCDEHYTAALAPLREFLADYGVREDSGVVAPSIIPMAKVPVKAAPEPAPMLWNTPVTDVPAPERTPNKDAQTAATPTACFIPGCADVVRRDKLSKHFHTVHHLDRSVLLTYCPVCEEEAAVMGVHARKVHDLFADELYEQVLAAGDPHQAVAKRLEAAKR